MANKIILHAAGGCGISVADKVMTKVSELGDGFSNIVFNYIDSSKANISKIEPRGDFYSIRQFSAKDNINIDGAGSERQAHSGNIFKSLLEYLDEKKIVKRVTGEYHMVLFSMSGGTGSDIGPILMKLLLEREIPALAVMVGDTSNMLSATNTYNTIASLSNIAKSINKPMVAYYINNHTVSDNFAEQEPKANNAIFNDISVISLFLSGEHESIDYGDMMAMLYPAYYKTITVHPGLHGLCVYDKSISNTSNTAIPLLARSLTRDDVDINLDIGFLHYKKGKIVSENVLSKYHVDKHPYLPLHMVLYNNMFVDIANDINDIMVKYNEATSKIVTDDISGSDKTVVDDETGLIL